MLLLLKGDARLPESPSKSSFAACMPCRNRKACLQAKLPIFCSNLPCESAILVYIKLRTLVNSSIATSYCSEFLTVFSRLLATWGQIRSQARSRQKKVCNISENCYNDDKQGYVVVICYSISVEIVLIVSCICWEKQIYYSQVSF